MFPKSRIPFNIPRKILLPSSNQLVLVILSLNPLNSPIIICGTAVNIVGKFSIKALAIASIKVGPIDCNFNNISGSVNAITKSIIICGILAIKSGIASIKPVAIANSISIPVITNCGKLLVIESINAITKLIPASIINGKLS